MENNSIDKAALKEVLRNGVVYSFTSRDDSKDHYDVFVDYIFSAHAHLLYAAIVAGETSNEAIEFFQEFDKYKKALAEIVIYLECRIKEDQEFLDYLDVSDRLDIAKKIEFSGRLQASKEILKFVSSRTKKED